MEGKGGRVRVKREKGERREKGEVREGEEWCHTTYCH